MQPAGLKRRLFAFGYDACILFAFLMLMGTIYGKLFGASQLDHQSQYFVAYQLYLLFCVTVFQVFFYVRGGQTLGMKAWKIKLVSNQNAPLTIKQALLRFIWSLSTIMLFGVGFWVLCFDSKKRTVYDILSDTKVVQVQ